jgi:hypothetical protein
MRTLIAILTIFILTSCQQESKRPQTIYEIDLAYSDGKTRLVSLRLDSTRKISIRIDNYEGSKYFRDTLSKRTFREISRRVDFVVAGTYDSIIDFAIPDCGMYNLILNSKRGRLNTMVYCSDYSTSLDSLVLSLVWAADNVTKETKDISTIFRSRNRIVPPAATKEFVRFVPPDFSAVK